MKFLTSVGLAAFLFLSGGVSQGATVIDFEDWTGGSGEQTLVNSRGFSLNNPAGFFISPDPGGGNSTQSLHTKSPHQPVVKVAS
jgi:hypothetical protein